MIDMTTRGQYLRVAVISGSYHAIVTAWEYIRDRNLCLHAKYRSTCPKIFIRSHFLCSVMKDCKTCCPRLKAFLCPPVVFGHNLNYITDINLRCFSNIKLLLGSLKLFL